MDVSADAGAGAGAATAAAATAAAAAGQDSDSSEALANSSADEGGETARSNQAKEDIRDLVRVRPSATKKHKRLFTKELGRMMYGFGDVKRPYEESVDCLDDAVTQFIMTMTKFALTKSQKRGVVRFEDLAFFIRKDRKKFQRLRELIAINEEISEARNPYKAKES